MLALEPAGDMLVIVRATRSSRSRARSKRIDESMSPFEKALIAHLVADWILQNNWMAQNKTSLRHPASWVHSSIQGICLGLALGWQAGVVLGAAHLFIDTRIPLSWWIRVFKKSDGSADAGTIAIGLDQTLHIKCIAIWLAFV